MPSPDSDKNEPSRMKRLISGDTEASPRSRPPSPGGSNSQRAVPDSQAVAAEAGPRRPRLKFMEAFWTIASLLSLAINLVLIVILLILFQMLGVIQGTANDKIAGLLGGLYDNFVKMDQAHIRTSIHVEKEIPVQFSLNVSGPTNVTLSQPVTINGALVTVQTGGLNITNARATIVLPQDTLLPINIQNLVVPVDQKVLAVLDVPVDIPLNQTELHEPFVGLQEVVEPWYCFIEPDAMFNGLAVCPPAARPLLFEPTPVGTVIP